jgi:hypothetical protein
MEAALVARLGLLLIGILLSAAAQASEATDVADRAGFLVGHAHRCGVAEARLERSRARIERVIAAFARDGDDKDAAEARLAQQILTGALGELLGPPLPACALVRSALTRFEAHRDPAATPSDQEEMMAEKKQSIARPGRTAAAGKPARAKPASTGREDLSPEGRAALALRQAAQKSRGKPPSL